MDRFDTIIWDLSQELGISLNVDEHGSCLILIDNNIPIHLEMDSFEEKLFVSVRLTELPPGRFREDLLESLLKINSLFFPLGTFCFEDKQNGVYIQFFVPLQALHIPSLCDVLTIFIKEVEKIAAIIEGGSSDYFSDIIGTNALEEKPKPFT